ncbi:MAG: sulfur carrier protein ThiS [Candidatus Aenigmatarchaeota archaeon]
MKIEVAWLGKAKKTETKSRTIENLLKELGINSETVIVSVNGEIVPESQKIRKNDRIEILKVVSGG